MIQLFSSNRAELLIDRLTGQLEAQRKISGMGLFEVVHVLGASRPMETYVKMAVARRSGVAANMRFDTIEGFVEERLARAAEPAIVLTRRALHTLLIHVLSDRERIAADPELEAVRRYLGPDDLRVEVRDRRAVQLAAQIAGLFEGYILHRGLVLDAWARGELCFDGMGAAASNERWQRRLWALLFDPTEGVVAPLERQRGMRLITLHDAAQWIAAGRVSLPKILHVVGLPTLGATGFRLMEAMSAHAVLFGYAINPCQEYWWDMRFGRPEEEEQLFSSAGVLGAEVETFDEEEAFWADGEDAPMLLRFWGFSGALQLKAAQQLEQLQTDEHYEPAEADTLLARLQRDMLTFTRPVPAPVEDDDRSLQIVGAPSAHREIEIIASEIWAMVRAREAARAADPSIEPLALHEIAVLINPAQRDVYQTTIRGVFYDSHRLPFNMIDMAASHYSQAIEAVQLLLALPFGQFKRQEFLRLLTHPNILARFPSIDPGDWLTWCDELKILHGADRNDHADTYIEDELFHWDQGLRRLTLGAFMAGQLAGDRRVFRLGRSEYLPHEYGQEDLSSAARLILMARSLIQDARFCRQARLSLAQWSELVCRLISTYIAAAGEDDVLNLQRCRQQIAALADLDFAGEPVSYRAAHGLMMEALAELEVKRGQHLLDGVVVASLLPERPLPFKAIFVVGLNEGSFPEPDSRRPEDLRFATDEEGHIRAPQGTLPDLAARDMQKWTLLEATLSARERLCLSYVSRDTRTGEALEPSSVVGELLYALEQDYVPREAGEDDAAHLARVRQRFVSEHELRRYHERYFPEVFVPLHDPGVPFVPTMTPSAQPEAEHEAQARALRMDLQAYVTAHELEFPSADVLQRAVSPDMWEHLRRGLGLIQAPKTSELQELDVLRVSTFDLRAFLECPMQGSARFLLRLGEEDAEDLLGAESELFETSSRARMRLLRDVFAEKLGKERRDGRPYDFGDVYDSRARYYELAGLVPTGPFYRAARQRHIRTLELWQDNLGLFGMGRAPKMEVRHFGRSPEHEFVDVSQDPIVLDVPLPQLDKPLRVEISGQTGLLVPGRPAALVPNTTSQVWSLSRRYFMRGFLDHVLLSAQGEPTPKEWQVLINPAEEAARHKQKHCMRRFKPLEQAEARGYLEGLLTDMLSRVHAYYMPVEAVFEFKEKGELAIDEIADRMRGSTWEKTSSDYGPVSHPERFDSPDDALDIIESRYGLFFDHLLDD